MKTRLEVHSLSSFPIFHINIEIIWRCMVVRSPLAEVSHDEAKMRERRETSFSHFCLVVRDLC